MDYDNRNLDTRRVKNKCLPFSGFFLLCAIISFIVAALV